MNNATGLSPRCSKFQAISVSLASLAVPVVLAIVGNAYATGKKDREIGARCVSCIAGCALRKNAREQRGRLLLIGGASPWSACGRRES